MKSSGSNPLFSRNNKKGKVRDLKVLLQGIKLPQATMTSTGAPPPRQKQEALQSSQAELFEFEFPQDTAGMAKLKKRQSGVLPSIAVHPILPKPSSSVCRQAVRFQMVLTLSVTPQPVSVASSQEENPNITHQVVRFPVVLTPTVTPQQVSAGSS